MILKNITDKKKEEIKSLRNYILRTQDMFYPYLRTSIKGKEPIKNKLDLKYKGFIKKTQNNLLLVKMIEEMFEENPFYFADSYLMSSVVNKSKVYTNELKNNSFINALPKEFEFSRFNVKSVIVPSYTFMNLGYEIDKIGNNVIPIETKCVSKENINYPVLYRGTKRVDSLSPERIEEIDNFVDTIKGDILQVGMGLGYFTYKAAMKPEVKSVNIYLPDECEFEEYTKITDNPIYKNIKNQYKIHFISNKGSIEEVLEQKYDFCYYSEIESKEDYLRVKSSLNKTSMGVKIKNEDKYVNELLFDLYTYIVEELYHIPHRKYINQEVLEKITDVELDGDTALEIFIRNIKIWLKTI